MPITQLLDASVCDDGNTVDGDGCSSHCAVEPGWVCFTASPTSSSACGVADAGTKATIASLQVRLNLPFVLAAASRAAFDAAVIEQLVALSGQPALWFVVLGISPGSVVVSVGVREPSGGPPPAGASSGNASGNATAVALGVVAQLSAATVVNMTGFGVVPVLAATATGAWACQSTAPGEGGGTRNGGSLRSGGRALAGFCSGA